MDRLGPAWERLATFEAFSDNGYADGRVFVGIDPGLSGAISAINSRGKLLVSYDMPTIRTPKKRVLDTDALGELLFFLDGYGTADPPTHIFAEVQQAMPGQGVVSMFSAGYGYGLIMGIASCLKSDVTCVRPREWQKEMTACELGCTKDRSLSAAARLFPELTLHKKGGQKHTLHGRSDSVLIAEYGRRLELGLLEELNVRERNKR